MIQRYGSASLVGYAQVLCVLTVRTFQEELCYYGLTRVACHVFDRDKFKRVLGSVGLFLAFAFFFLWFVGLWWVLVIAGAWGLAAFKHC